MADEDLEIQKITDISKLNRLIHLLKRRRDELFEEQWEKRYKSRCPKHYLSMSGFVHNNIEYWNNLPSRNSFVEELKENHNEINILNVLRVARKYDLVIPIDAVEMVCESCACLGCSYMKKDLGYDCETCKTVLAYTGYQENCDD